MGEQKVAGGTYTFLNQKAVVSIKCVVQTKVHVTVDGGPRGNFFFVKLIVGPDPNGLVANGKTAIIGVDDDQQPRSVVWTVAPGTYTVVLDTPPGDPMKPKPIKTVVDVYCDPPPQKVPTVPHTAGGAQTQDPSAVPHPGAGNVHGSSGSGASGSGTGSLGTGTTGTGSSGGSGAGLGVGGPAGGHLGPENPGGSGNTLGPGAAGPSAGPGTSSDPNASPTEQGGPPVDKAGNPESGPPLGGPPGDPSGPGPAPGGPQPGDPGDPGGPQPGDPGGGGPTPTEKGGGGPQPGDPGGGGPTPGGPQPGGDPGGGGPPPADPKTGGGGPPPADPNGPPPGNPEGGGGGDPQPPPPAPEFPPDWVMNAPAVLGTVQAARVAAILGGAQGHSSPEAALGAGVALGAAISGALAGLGMAGVGAMHVEAHVGPLHGQAHASERAGAGHLAFLYVPQGAPVRSIRFHESRSGAVQTIEVHPNGLLVFRSELVVEVVGEKDLPLVHGRMALPSS